MCVPWFIDVCAMIHLCVCHDSFMCVPWLVYVCGMTGICVWDHTLIGAASNQGLPDVGLLPHDHQRPHSVRMPHKSLTHCIPQTCLRHPSHMPQTSLAHLPDMPHSRICITECLRHASFSSLTWLILTFDLTHSYLHDMTQQCVLYAWHASFIFATWLIRTWGMTHAYVRQDSFIYATWLIHMCDMTHFASTPCLIHCRGWFT